MSLIYSPPLPQLGKKYLVCCLILTITCMYVYSSLLCRVNQSDLDPKEPVEAEEPVLAKKPPKEQKVIKEMHFITTDEFNGVPA